MGWARGNQGQRTAMPNLVAFWCVSIGGCLKIRLSQLLRSSRWRGFPPVGCQRGGLGPCSLPRLRPCLARWHSFLAHAIFHFFLSSKLSCPSPSRIFLYLSSLAGPYWLRPSRFEGLCTSSDVRLRSLDSASISGNLDSMVIFASDQLHGDPESPLSDHRPQGNLLEVFYWSLFNYLERIYYLHVLGHIIVTHFDF